jgi:hypothetical protein
MEVSGQFHTPAALPHRERAHGSHRIGGSVGHIASLEAVERRKKSPAPVGDQTPAIQPVAQRKRRLSHPGLSKLYFTNMTYNLICMGVKSVLLL